MRISPKISCLLLSFVLFLVGCSKEESVENHTLEITINPEEGGTVSPSPGTYSLNEELQLKATPSSDYVFKEWTGSMTGTENPVSLKMNGNKDINAVFEKKETVFSREIVGKWDIINQKSSAKTSIVKTQDSSDGCAVFSMVFNSDETFVLNHSQGTFRGNYSIDSPMSIVLQNVGRIDNVAITDESITFIITLTDLCSFEGTGENDADYAEGDCSSFLECNEAQIWSLNGETSVQFIQLWNKINDIWIEKVLVQKDMGCKKEASNSSGDFILVANNTSRLAYLQPLEDGSLALIEITLNGDGSLTVTYDVDQDEQDTTNTYNSTTTTELDSYSSYPLCSEHKTYIPDDAFELRLIELGHDDEMDDYVLTENISKVENLNLGSFITLSDLTGIEAFISLKYFYLSNSPLKTADFSANVNLVSLFLSEGPLEHLNISKNIKLKTLIINYTPALKKLDITNNIELETIHTDAGSGLTSIDISKNEKLIDVYLESNKLTADSIIAGNNSAVVSLRLGDNSLRSIDLSHYPNLEYLDIYQNPLESLDLSHNPKLKVVKVWVNTSTNQFFTLNIGNNTLFEELHLGNILLNSIDLKHFQNLRILNLSENNLSELDVSQNPSLESLDLSENNLSELDVSQLSKLEYLDLKYNNLQQLDVSFNSNLKAVDALRNPDLKCVKVSQAQLDGTMTATLNDGVPLSTDCGN